jgi:hypothetical protein
MTAVTPPLEPGRDAKRVARELELEIDLDHAAIRRERRRA